MTFQELIAKLTGYWADQGAVVVQPYDMEMGAGTMHPETFFRVLGEMRRGRWCTCSPPAGPPTGATARTRTVCTSTTSSSSS